MVLSGNTLASFSDTASTPSTFGSATVKLGDDVGPELGYEKLRPGVAQTVQLTITYDGTVAAGVGLSFAPDGESAFCEQNGGAWVARPGRAVTLSVGTGPEESYCSLLGGAVLPLGTVQEAGSLEVPVTVTLAEGAGPDSVDLTDSDIATVHADGGFTDRVAGHITMSTAPADEIPAEPVGTPEVVVAALSVPGAEASVALDVADPAATARLAPAEAGIALPVECLDAGIAPKDITEVIALDAALPAWDAITRRGRGAGPFLVLGTAVADTITGSTKGDCIVGGGGADTIAGGDGYDVIVGGAGADDLNGEAGDDRLLGDAGLDNLRGSTGRDLLDGGADAATCDTAPGEDATRCRPPAATPAPVVPPTPAPPAPSEPAPVPVEPAPESATVPTPAETLPPAEEIPAADGPPDDAGPVAGADASAPARVEEAATETEESAGT